MQVLNQKIELPALDLVERWHVLHTRSRCEKKLAADLEAMGIHHFLPLVRKVTYYRYRKVEVALPLFPGYVFLHGTNDQAYSADRTKMVAHIIPVFDQKTLEWELKNIRLALENEAPLTPTGYISKGDMVEVMSGPFKGLQGIVDRVKNDGRLVLQVDAFGQAVGLEIDRDLLQRI